MPRNDPTEVWMKVVLADLYKPEDYFVVMSNPPSLSIQVAVESGELHPVGWSSGVDMYGHTKSAGFDLTLRLSAFELSRQNGGRAWPKLDGVPPIEAQIRWLTSFAYPRDLGVSPAPLLVYWPNIMSIACRVTNVNLNYEMFDVMLQTRIATVTLTLRELRQAFKTADTHINKGFFDEGNSISGAGANYKLGSRVKFK